MLKRPRRLRLNENIRNLSRETRLSTSSLIMPLFIKQGDNLKEPIETMDGQFRYSVDRALEFIEKSSLNGINKFILFGIPLNELKDEYGTSAYCNNNVISNAIKAIKGNFKNIILIADVCMCEYTSHGHCGILNGDYVDNDSTLEYLNKIALSYANAGCDIIAPSDMMDNRVLSIRNALDKDGYINTAIMSYAVKYASAFYGPFRQAASSSPSFGDRKSYQMDYHNKKEAIKEIILDDNEGADILMIKPALSYLDIINEATKNTNLPICAYSVSGEYAMIKAASKCGYIDEYKTVCETATSIFRAGANMLISYYANEISKAITKGDIG